MTYEELIDLINYLDQSNIAFMDYETKDEHIVLSKEVPQLPVKEEASANLEAIQSASASKEASAVIEEPLQETEAKEAESAPEEKAGKAVESPMVGVVYLQPHPDEDPYVKVGDHVEQGDVVCIVEAMKLMNEIKAPHSGVVTEILVENEAVVEYKQPLIRIDS